MGLNTYDDLAINRQPELIFGLVGPIGVNMTEVQKCLETALRTVNYNPVNLRITEIMQMIDTGESISETSGPLDYYTSRMDYANAVRKKSVNNAALAALSILVIKDFRNKQHHLNKPLPIDESKISPLDCPLPATAYVIRQLKTKEEVALLRAVYGKKFIQVSVHADEESRLRNLSNSITIKSPEISTEEAEEISRKLIKRDLNEADQVNGQRLEKIFFLGDVFVDANSDRNIQFTVNRFIEALFGKNSISPTRDEYGSYIAASASLRSLDPSRQVGAAVFTKQGEIISMGSNEVPKFGGGTYWSDDENPHRDFDDKRMPNHVRRNRMIYDIINKLDGKGALKNRNDLVDLFNLLGDEENIELIRKIMRDEIFDSALINDITEYGRMTHAEMNAITDAARLGIPTKGATLFSTTFPCHNCAKHIVAAGISRVVYIEPYPKSQALDLNGDSISLGESEDEKVQFCNFVGISPRRYRDIFEKGKRRDALGNYKEWYEDTPAPRVLDRGAGYVLNESSAILNTLDKVSDELTLIPEE